MGIPRDGIQNVVLARCFLFDFPILFSLSTASTQHDEYMDGQGKVVGRGRATDGRRGRVVIIDPRGGGGGGRTPAGDAGGGRGGAVVVRAVVPVVVEDLLVEDVVVVDLLVVPSPLVDLMIPMVVVGLQPVE